MSRLNKTKRERIVANIMNDTEDKSIPQSFKSRIQEIGTWLLTEIYSKEQDIVKRLPSAWYRKTRHVYVDLVNKDDPHGRPHYHPYGPKRDTLKEIPVGVTTARGMYLHSEIPTSKEFLVPRDHMPVELHPTHWAYRELEALHQDITEYVAKRVKFRKEIENVVNAVNTIPQLLKMWPELGEKELTYLEGVRTPRKSTALIPTETLQALNKQMGIGLTKKE